MGYLLVIFVLLMVDLYKDEQQRENALKSVVGEEVLVIDRSRSCMKNLFYALEVVLLVVK